MMLGTDIRTMCVTGMQIGLGIAVIPTACTTLIACSKIIVVNIIGEIATRILTANTYSLTIHGISFVSVPLLWQISWISAMAGGALIALSFLIGLVNQLYQKYISD